MLVYEVKIGDQSTEYETIHKAREACEQAGKGSIITWVVEPNLPGRKPDKVYRSCDLRTLTDGAWYALDISGPGTSRFKLSEYDWT
jgi:hypothetical protein